MTKLKASEKKSLRIEVFDVVDRHAGKSGTFFDGHHHVEFTLGDGRKVNVRISDQGKLAIYGIEHPHSFRVYPIAANLIEVAYD